MAFSYAALRSWMFNISPAPAALAKRASKTFSSARVMFSRLRPPLGLDLSALSASNRRLRHLTFAQQHHLNALTPLGISFPAQRCLQPTDFAFGAFDHLFPPNQMVKESHLASKGKPRPCPPPSTTAVSIQPAMEVVSVPVRSRRLKFSASGNSWRNPGIPTAGT